MLICGNVLNEGVVYIQQNAPASFLPIPVAMAEGMLGYKTAVSCVIERRTMLSASSSLIVGCRVPPMFNLV